MPPPSPQRLPELAEERAEQFDSVVLILPSTIYHGSEGGAIGVLRTALRLTRPQREWKELVELSHKLLCPGGQFLIADVVASSWPARACLPLSVWRPCVGVELLEQAGFEVECVPAVPDPGAFPGSVFSETMLRAVKPGS